MADMQYRFAKHTLDKTLITESRMLTYRGRTYTTSVPNADSKVIPFARRDDNAADQQAA